MTQPTIDAPDRGDVIDTDDIYRAAVRDGRFTLIPDPDYTGEMEPDTARFGSRLITILGAFTGPHWRLSTVRLEYTTRPGTTIEDAHAEAIRQIIRSDLATGGADKVEDTLTSLITGVTVDAVTAVFRQGMTSSTVTIHASGLIITDVPAQVEKLLNTVLEPEL